MMGNCHVRFLGEGGGGDTAPLPDKGKGQLLSVEGKTNKQGIRWREGSVLWGPLTLVARLPADDPVVAHALASRIKYVRLVRRVLNGRVRFFAQLVCAGKPYRKVKKHPIGTGVVGLDPGPRTFGLAGANWGAQVDLAAPFVGEKRAQRRLRRKLDRQRRANNPANDLPDGRAKPGPKRWRKSQNQRDTEDELAEALRREAAHRKSLHGQLATAVLRLGDDIRIEKNSYRSFQQSYGKAVGQAAPATFESLLTRKAAGLLSSRTRPTMPAGCMQGLLRQRYAQLNDKVQSADVMMNMGTVHVRLGNNEQAHSLFQEALRSYENLAITTTKVVIPSEARNPGS